MGAQKRLSSLVLSRPYTPARTHRSHLLAESSVRSSLVAERRWCCEIAVSLRRVRKGGLYVHRTRSVSQSSGCMNMEGVPRGVKQQSFVKNRVPRRPSQSGTCVETELNPPNVISSIKQGWHGMCRRYRYAARLPVAFVSMTRLLNSIFGCFDMLANITGARNTDVQLDLSEPKGCLVVYSLHGKAFPCLTIVAIHPSNALHDLLRC